MTKLHQLYMQLCDILMIEKHSLIITINGYSTKIDVLVLIFIWSYMCCIYKLHVFGNLIRIECKLHLILVHTLLNLKEI